AGSLGGPIEAFDDGTALRLLFRHANFDNVSNAVVYDPAVARRDLPDSLYLTAKPAFFGSLRWPWVDPTGTPRVGILPAKQRFDSTGFPREGASSWMPPESVSTRRQRDINATKFRYPCGAMSRTFGRSPRSRFTCACTFGFRWTG